MRLKQNRPERSLIETTGVASPSFKCLLEVAKVRCRFMEVKARFRKITWGKPTTKVNTFYIKCYYIKSCTSSIGLKLNRNAGVQKGFV